jgi:hypothetical protein
VWHEAHEPDEVSIKEKNWQPLALKLQEARDVAKGKLADCRMRLRRVTCSTLRSRQEETQSVRKHLKFIQAIVDMVNSVADGVIAGAGGDHHKG